MRNNRRQVEWGKNLLILLLSLSALYLLTMTPLIQDSGILSLFSRQAPREEPPSAVTLTAAAHPARMAVSDGRGRYGVQYDQDAVDDLFARMGSLLGEALTSCGQPEPLPEARWQGYLADSGIYFDFAGEIPLSALGAWLQPEGTCPLTAAARRVLLAAGEGDEVVLCYQDVGSGLFYACTTGLTQDLHLTPTVESVTENGAQFAFESEEWSRLLAPYTLIAQESARECYTAANPVSSTSVLTTLLDALSFSTHNHASVSDGELYLDGNDRLRVLSGGTVVYDAAQGGKYPVATAGETMTMAEAIEAARRLAQSTMGSWSGEAELSLLSATATQDGFRIRFGYRLDGSAVWLYDDGWAGEFNIRSGFITDFTLRLRSYTATGEKALLLSMDRAAAMLPNLTEERRELILQYRDPGDTSVSPLWVAG